MAPPLTSIFNAINAQITLNLAAQNITPTYGIAAIDRQFSSTPPRIVWVPTTEDIGPARGQGGDVSMDGQRNMNIAANPPIATRTSTVECDVWGINRDTVDEYMIDAVFSAVQDLCSQGSYGVVRADWLKPEEILKKGECYRIWFQFMIPVKRVTPQTTTATINTMPETPAIVPIVG